MRKPCCVVGKWYQSSHDGAYVIHGPGLPSRVADIAFIGHLVLEYHVQLGDTMMHQVVYPELLYYYGRATRFEP